jgi:hypothetical protein
MIAVSDHLHKALMNERSTSSALHQRNSVAEASIESWAQRLSDAQNSAHDLEEQRDGLNVALDEASKGIAELQPSDRDRVQFNSVLDDLPWDRGIVPWLQMSPLKQWTETQSDPIYSLDAKWSEWFFDSVELERSFALLREKVHDFTQWMAMRGFALNSAEIRASGWNEGDPMVYRIVSGSERVDGWAGHDRDRDEGNSLAVEIIDRRREFERVGRAARV